MSRSQPWEPPCLIGVLLVSARERLTPAAQLLANKAAQQQATDTPPPDRDATLAALQEMRDLAAAADLEVLQRYADLRGHLSGLPEKQFEALGLALRKL